MGQKAHTHTSPLLAAAVTRTHMNSASLIWWSVCTLFPVMPTIFPTPLLQVPQGRRTKEKDALETSNLDSI